MSPRAVAVNVGANTNEPGFRGPVDADGSFTFVPIPESEPTRSSVPTYGDLDPHLDVDLPDGLAETPVHLDPTFAEYPLCDRYTYGDPHPVKAGPLSALAAGDYVFFYATLAVTQPADWLPPEWGAFLVGHFRLAREPITHEDWSTLGGDERELVAGNAHRQRETMDARVLLAGAPATSALYDRAVALSLPSGGTDPGPLVTDHSGDSGRGPWWRRPLSFDESGTVAVLDRIAATGAARGCYHR